MLRLPPHLSAHLVGPGGTVLSEPEVLIAINFLRGGRYYYGNLIGLTDERGIATIERSEIELRFAMDRSTYPMDYKVDLEECDPSIEVTILSEAELSEARRAIDGNPGVSEAIQHAYAVARNALLRPAVSRVWADSLAGQSLVVFLTTGWANAD